MVMVGLVGVILYFPCKMSSGHTCLFEHLKSDSHNHKMSEQIAVDHHHQMTQHYVVPFGVIWWFSIAAVWWAAAGTWNKRKKTHESKN